MKSKQLTPGSLDPLFGKAGKVAYRSGNGFFAGQAKVMDDGKVLVVGPLEDAVCIVRFLADGKVDTSFGKQGIVTTVLREGIRVENVKWAFQDKGDIDNGDIVVAARLVYMDDTDYALVVARFSENGVLDKTFGKAGVTEIVIRKAQNQVTGLSVSKTGITVTVLQVWGFDIYAALIVALMPNGLTNETFGGGIVHAPARYFYGDILTRSDGKIIIAGRADDASTLILARYNTNGSLDDSYGNQGFFEYRRNDKDLTQAHGIAFGSDERVLIAGSMGNFGDLSSEGLLLRVTSEGELDSAFNEGKPVVVSIGDLGSQNMSVVVQPDGLIGILATTIGAADVAVIRVHPTGKLDETFGTAGIAVVDFDKGTDLARSINVQNDGKLLICAVSYFIGRVPQLSMARLTG